MVYYKNVIVNILWILILFVLKIISFLKIRVMALLFLMVMNKFIIKLPLSAWFFFTPECIPCLSFSSVLEVSGSATVSFTESSVCWDVELCPCLGCLPGSEVCGSVIGSSTDSSVGSGVAVCFLLVIDAVMV